MEATPTVIRPHLPRLLTQALVGSLAFGVAATLLHEAASPNPAALWIRFVAYAGAYVVGSVAATLLGWHNHRYSLFVAGGKLEMRGFWRRQSVPIAGLPLASLEHLSLRQRLGTSLTLTGLDGSLLRLYPANFSHAELNHLRLILQAHGAA
jgi:hypothetical protein